MVRSGSHDSSHISSSPLVLFRQFLHDEEIYHDPLAFNPDRFLRADGSLDPDVRDPSAAFGFGRRICVGRYLAIESLWIAIACVLSLFDIKKVVGEDGKEITPKAEYIRGFVWCVPSFTDSHARDSSTHSTRLLQAPEALPVRHRAAFEGP